MNNYGQIYKITNQIDGKVYIGQTINSLEKRLREHIYSSRLNQTYNSCLFRAIRKYGESNFTILFNQLLKKYNIKSVQEAIHCNELWNLNLGITVCIPCHHKCHSKEKNV